MVRFAGAGPWAAPNFDNMRQAPKASFVLLSTQHKMLLQCCLDGNGANVLSLQVKRTRGPP